MVEQFLFSFSQKYVVIGTSLLDAVFRSSLLVVGAPPSRIHSYTTGSVMVML